MPHILLQSFMCCFLSFACCGACYRGSKCYEKEDYYTVIDQECIPPKLEKGRCIVITDSIISSENECSICLLEYELSEKARKLKCGHIYHIGCYEIWLDKNSKNIEGECPQCDV